MYSNDADKKFMDTKYQNIINAENLLKFASKKSAEQILLRESRRGKDDYECICINVNIKMYIFDHLRMYKFAYSSSVVMYSLNR